MATRFIHQASGAAESWTGSHAGIGVDEGVLYYNPDGSRRAVAVNQSPGTTYYVDPQNGASTNSGKSWGKAFASFSSLDSILDHGDTILFTGFFDGTWNAPYKNDISLIGVANTPRQATDSGVHNGAGATWLNTTPTAAPLLTINKQGWLVKNIFFNNADTTNNSSCIKLLRDLEAVEADASHTSIIGCKFTGEEHGVLGSGGVGRITIQGCTFSNFDSTGDCGITNVTGAGAGVPIEWRILGNQFENNVNHISCGATGALVSAQIIGNTFSWKRGSGVTTTLQVDLGTVGVDCIVMGNYFQCAHAETNSSTMFLPQSTANSWLNFYRDGLVALVPAT